MTSYRRQTSGTTSRSGGRSTSVNRTGRVGTVASGASSTRRRAAGSDARSVTSHGSSTRNLVTSIQGSEHASTLGHTTLLEKRRGFYKETEQQLPLWGIRKITINPRDPDTLAQFPNNEMRTRRYAPWSFLPVSIYRQFLRPSNLWYLFIALVQLGILYVDKSHVNSSLAGVLAPYVVLTIAVGLLKEGCEEFQRFLYDSKTAAKNCTVVDGASESFKTATWKSLKVGQIVRVHEGEEVPADIILLATAHPDGAAYFEDALISGQRHLGAKFAIKETRGEITSQAICNVRGRLVCDEPGTSLTEFSGSLRLDAHPRATPVDIHSFVLRGSSLVQTHWIHGVVVYTGRDTRIARNAGKLRYKRDHLRRYANTITMLGIILHVFYLLVGWLVVLLILPVHQIVYLHVLLASVSINNVTVITGTTIYPKKIMSFFQTILLLADTVPLGMWIILDGCRILQSMSLARRKDLTESSGSDSPLMTLGLCCDVQDALGRADILLMDKTGTMTTPGLVFEQCYAGGKLYGHTAGENSEKKQEKKSGTRKTQNKRQLVFQETEPLTRKGSDATKSENEFPQDARYQEESKEHSSKTDTQQPIRRKASTARLGSRPLKFRTFRYLNPEVESRIQFRDERILRDLGKRDSRGNTLRDFIKALSVCNSVTPLLDLGPMIYQFQEDDAETSKNALGMQLPPTVAGICVQTATKGNVKPERSMRWRRTPTWDSALVSSVRYRTTSPDEECFVAAAAVMGIALICRSPTMLAIEVNGELRRFDIIGVNPFTPKRQRMSIIVCEEGTESPVLYCKGSAAAMLPVCSMATTGQCSADRVDKVLRRFGTNGLRAMIFAKKVLTWTQCETYTRLLRDDQGAFDREVRMSHVANAFESELEILGLTGLRESMARGLNTTLSSLTAAGIRVWMVTGDATDTAIHVAYASGLVPPRSSIFHVNAASREARTKRDAVRSYEEFKQHIFTRRPKEHIVVVATGVDFVNFTSSHDTRVMFLSMAMCADQVLFTEMNPLQKALVVETLRSSIAPEPVVLSIGDGINDAAMLQASHCGISLRDDSQMGTSSEPYGDVALASVRALTPLLLVHGRYNNIRSTLLLHWLWLTNVALTIPQALFSRAALFTYTPLVSERLKYMLQTIFMTLPALIFGMAYTDVDAHIALNLPALYTLTRRRLYFTAFSVFLAGFEGFFIGLFVHVMQSQTNLETSHILTVEDTGAAATCIILGAAVAKLLLVTSRNTPSAAVLIGSLMTFWSWIIHEMSSDSRYEIIWPDEGISRAVIWVPSFWFSLLLILGITYIIHQASERLLAMVHPDFGHFVQLTFASRLRRNARQQDNRKKGHSRTTTHQGRRSSAAENKEANHAILDDDTVFPSGDVRLQKLKKVYHYYDPVRHRRIAQRLPKVRRFRLRRRSANGHETGLYPPLPLVTEIDRVTVLAMLRHRDRDKFLHYQLQGAGLGLGQRPTRSPSATTPVTAPETTTEPHHDDSQTNGRADSTSDGMSLESHRLSDIWQPQSECSLDELQLLDIDGYFDEESDHTLETKHEKGSVVRVTDLIQPVTLKFIDQQLEADYQLHRRRSTRRYIRSYRLMASILLALTVTISCVDYLFLRAGARIEYYDLLLSLLTNVTFLCLLVATFYEAVFSGYFDAILGTVSLLLGVYKTVGDYLRFKDGAPSTAIYIVLVFVVFRLDFLHGLIYSSMFIVAYLIRYILNIMELKRHINSDAFEAKPITRRQLLVMSPGTPDRELLALPQLLRYIPILLGIMAFTGYAAYRMEYNQRKAFLLDYQVQVARRKQREILNTMLPSFVVDEMLNCTITKDGIPLGLKAEDRGTVTVLFCDVNNFQSFVASVEPKKLVKVLDTLFLCFDKCADQFGCTKIETVFETYLAAAGLQQRREQDDPQEDAFDALEMALAMIEVTKHMTYTVAAPRETETFGPSDSRSLASETSVTRSRGTSYESDRAQLRRVQVKIGIHSGRVVSGIVGAKKPQYALFGDTVNTASRMKSTGKPDHVHISESTYSFVHDDDTFTWEKRQIEVKGKGVMKTYLLVAVQGTEYGVVASSTKAEADDDDDNNAQDEDDDTSTAGVPVRTARIRNPLDVVRTLRFTSKRQRQPAAGSPTEVSATSSRDSTPASVVPKPPTSSKGTPTITVAPPCLSPSEPTSTAPGTAGASKVTFALGTAHETEGHTQPPSPPHASSKPLERLSQCWKRWRNKHKEQDVNQTSILHQKVPMHYLFLTLENRGLEKRYQSHLYTNPENLYGIEQAIIIFLITFVFQTLIFVAVPRVIPTGVVYVKSDMMWYVRSTFCVCAFILWLLLRHRELPEIQSLVDTRYLIFFLNLNFITAACTFILSNAWGYHRDDDNSTIWWLYTDDLELFLYLTIIHYNTGLLFQHVFFVDLLIVATALTFILIIPIFSDTSVVGLLFVPIFTFANALTCYFKEYTDRTSFVANEEMCMTEERGRDLLKDMLPKGVLEEFQQDKLRLAYQHDKMTFLFADICGFTSWAKNVEGVEVVQVLQQLFGKFDRDTTRFGLYKLCTIGDAYVTVTEPSTEDTVDNVSPAVGAENVLRMAYAMIENIKIVRERLNVPSLNMRIGAHYGKCVGGVIGSGRLRYDIWGIDVLTGNMMESAGVPGHICVSGPFREFLMTAFPKRFRFIYHKRVHVINKHEVDSYILSEASKYEESSNNSSSLFSDKASAMGGVFHRDVTRINRHGASKGTNRAVDNRAFDEGFDDIEPT